MKLLILTFIFFCSYNLLQSQEPVIRFQHLTPESGLSQGHVLCMMQDKEGYIWIGTYYGLNRFNGYSFKHFSKDKSNSQAVVSDVIYCLLEDHLGYIWVGTVSGLDVFDKKTETFEHIPVYTNGGLNDGYIRTLAQDQNGDIWVGTNSGGLNKIDYKTRKISCITADSPGCGQLTSNTINELLPDQQGNLWIATEGGGLNLLDKSTGEIKNLKAPFNKITSLLDDRNGNMWLGNSDGQLAQYNIRKRVFKIHQYLPADLKNKALKIRDLARDIHGNILIATIGAGLISYNPVSGKSIIYQNDVYDNFSISSDEAYSLLVDRSRTVFVGTYGRGISRYSPYNMKFPVFYNNHKNNQDGDINSYTSCVQDYKGRLIIGTYSGFFVYEKDWSFRHILPGRTYAENKILVITIAPDSTIWMGTNRGIHQYDKDLNKITTYNLIDDNLDHQIYCLYFDQSDNLWVSMFVTEGLFKIPPGEWRNKSLKKLRFKNYKTDYNDSTTLFGDQVWTIREDKRKNIWIGTNIGICRYNPKTDNFTRYNITDLCKTIEFDSDHNMWIATRGEGIYKYNTLTGKTKHYTTADGLSQNFVFGVIVDQFKKLWFSSENGLSKFDPLTESFRNYDIFDGLPHNRFDDRSEKLLPDGRIYMGTAKGFTIFHPSSVIDDTSRSRVVLTNLVISNKPVLYYTYNQENPVPVGRIEHLVLTPDQKDFSFGFASLHYSAPHKIRYKYKLEGFDKQWIYTDAKNRIARYTNLDGGNYTFYVMATNGDGVWNDTPLQVAVTVKPPMVKTLAFKLILAFIAGVLVFMFTHWQRERVINQNINLARMVDERTAEISEKNKLLEDNALVLNHTNALLEKKQTDIELQKEELSRQRDKLMELNATKDKLFSVIAHDLKNPFNVIIGFSELIMNNYHAYNDEKRLRITSQINQASKTAFHLLENLLEWSRTQKGNIIFNPVEIDLKELVNTGVSQVKDFARNKEVSIHIHLNSLDQLVVRADVNMINTVLRNLLSNAVKFSHRKGQVFVHTVLMEHNRIRFSVIDQGTGMTAEISRNLFRLDNNQSTPGTLGEKGTGLGLLICKDFIEAHKGSIWVESEPGEGTAFHFYIPIKDSGA